MVWVSPEENDQKKQEHVLVQVSNFRVTVLVENMAEGREYTVEETYNSEEEVSQITVQDPLR